MTLETLYDLDQIQAAQRSSVGDKAFFLSVLQQEGFPVVPGLVVSASVFRQFLETITWSEPLFEDLPGSSLYLNVDNPAQLQIVAQQIRREIEKTPLWQDWLEQIIAKVQPWQASALIVRPSVALKSGNDPMLGERISGLLQSQVCSVETAAIAQAIRRVWAELYRARSLVYWQRCGVLLQHINLALLIQPIESAIAAGDVRVNSSELIVRSVWGLGQALSEGEVSPDVVELHPTTGEVVHYHISEKSHRYELPRSRSHEQLVPLETGWVEESQQRQPSITPAQTHELTQLCRRISAALTFPLVMEWVLHRQGVQITQATPSAVSLLNSQRSMATRSVLTGQPEYPSESHSTPLTLTGLAAAQGQAIATALVLHDAEPWPSVIPPKTAIVLSTVTPELLLHLKQAAGLITDEGTLTSHGAIVARELGIPAVVGTRVATHHLRTGDLLSIDGDRGIIQRLPSVEPDTDANVSVSDGLPAALQPQHQTERYAASLRDAPATTVPLWVNLSQAETAVQVAALPVDGVGLLRAEMMIRNVLEGHTLSEWVAQGTQLASRIADYLTPIVTAFAPRPVFYRAMDLRSHEFVQNAVYEPNPVLGLHGALNYTLHPALFDIELAALRSLQQAGHTNLHLMLPFVRTVEEVQFCRDRAVQRGLLYPQTPMQLWVMAEVPSVLFLVPELVEAGVQGISIGSNDLAQLLLALDRDNPETAAQLNSGHPAVMRAIHQLIVAAREAGIPCSICGQTPAEHPELIEKLVQWGISSISVSPDALAATRWAIAQAEHHFNHGATFPRQSD